MSRAVRLALWWAGSLALLLLCLGSAADRFARAGVLIQTPAWLPAGGNTLLARAEQAEQAGDLPRAVALARAGLVRRPIDAPALRIMGALLIDGGDRARGGRLLRLAGGAGWRDPPTQIYWAGAAMAQRDWAVAAQRVEAVARLGRAADANALLTRLEATPAGRAALVARWDGQADWLLAALATWPRDPAAMANRYATVQTLRPRLTSATRDRLAAPLLAAGRADWAFAIIRPDERTLGFDTGEPFRPLGWTLAADAGLDASVEQGGILRVQASGPALVPLAWRLVRLPVGETELRLPIEGAHTDLPVLATLQCLTGNGAAAAPGPAPFTFMLRVPAGCPIQRLALAVAGEEARRGADFRLSPPVLARASGAPSP